jgi:hypothetical protein
MTTGAVSGMGVLAGSVSLAGPPACGTWLFLFLR